MNTQHAQCMPGRVLRAFFVCATLLAACEDDAVDPATLPNAAVEASGSAFADTDPLVGTDETITIEITNDGGAGLEVSSVALGGANAAEFSLDAAPPFSVPAGGTIEVALAFMPASVGDKSATVLIMSNDPGDPRIEVPVTGRATSFQYTQVDRKGIPGLNTVFNHPSGTAGFSKRSYNVVSPAGDVATYSGQFETVLGAVGNPNPAATAALLLPDELPVSLGAATTAFGMLTGRALADDAVDVALSVTVGIAALQSDNVDANDKAFRATFPYVAAPH
jgi:hypothetical protein